jgi:hypothetical protein
MLMPLRDPAERLESGMRYEALLPDDWRTVPPPRLQAAAAGARGSLGSLPPLRAWLPTLANFIRRNQTTIAAFVRCYGSRTTARTQRTLSTPFAPSVHTQYSFGSCVCVYVCARSQVHRLADGDRTAARLWLEASSKALDVFMQVTNRQNRPFLS